MTPQSPTRLVNAASSPPAAATIASSGSARANARRVGRSERTRRILAPLAKRQLDPDTGAAAGRARHVEAAVEHVHAVGEAAQAGAACRVGAADAVVGDLDLDAVAAAAHAESRLRRLRVLGDVRERLRG